MVKNSSNNTPTSSQIEALTSLAYLDGAQESIIDFGATINASNNIITINPDSDMEEWRLVQVTFGSGFLDTVGNVAGGATAAFQTRDITPPGIDSDSLDPANTAVFFTSSEGLYTNDDESGGLTVADFEISNFNANGGNVSSITINSLTNFSGVPLLGDETEIRINISTDNTASGSETFSIGPVEGQVFDQGGNVLDPAANTQAITL